MAVRDHTIGDVSKTLLDLLRLRLSDISGRIALQSPRVVDANLLTLFLYKVLENPYLKNEQEITTTAPTGRIEQKPAPLTVDL